MIEVVIYEDRGQGGQPNAEAAKVIELSKEIPFANQRF
jgi:hypothetical protein